MPVERAYIYFFNDNDKPGLHASAGITRHFQPKPSFHALAHLQRALGDYRFQQVVINEPGKLRVQEYRHGQTPNKWVWAVWSPTGEGKLVQHTRAKPPGRLAEVQRMPLGAVESALRAPSASQNRDGAVEVQVSEDPLYLFFEKP